MTRKDSTGNVTLRLDRNSKLVQWAYFDLDDLRFGSYIPKQTSLCAFFWRCVLWTPLKLMMPITAIGFIGMGLWLLGQKFWANPPLFWAVFWLGAASAGFIHLIRTAARVEAPEPMTKASTVLLEGIKAIKSKVCPRIELQ